MEKIVIERDTPLICKLVAGFPQGIKEAFDELGKEFGLEDRTFYGVSYMDKDNKIVYFAAVAENWMGEAISKGYEEFNLRAGEYLGKTLINWMAQTDQMKVVFTALMKDPRFDNQFPCIEIYTSDKEMTCMVRVKD